MLLREYDTEHLHTPFHMQAGASMQIPKEKIVEDCFLCKKKMLTLTVSYVNDEPRGFLALAGKEGKCPAGIKPQHSLPSTTNEMFFSRHRQSEAL